MVKPARVLGTLLPSLAAVLLAWSPASAGPPTDRLRGFFGKVNEVLTDPTTEQQPLERVARIRRLVTDLTDIPSAAAIALGPQWATRTPAEREEFAELFAELLERAYVGRLAGAVRVTGVVTLAYVDEVVTGDAATVTTKVSGTQGQVEYQMTLRGGRWLVRDIVLDGVSVVDNYRAQFKRLLQQDAFPAVMTAMRTKLAGESLLFAGLPRRATPIVSAPTPESQAIAAAPPVPDDAPRPPTMQATRKAAPTPRVEPARLAPRPPKVVVAAIAPATRRPATAIVAAATTTPVVASASRASAGSASAPPGPISTPVPAGAISVSAPAGAMSASGAAASLAVSAPAEDPAPESSATSIAIVVAAALLGVGLGGLLYRHLRG